MKIITLLFSFSWVFSACAQPIPEFENGDLSVKNYPYLKTKQNAIQFFSNKSIKQLVESWQNSNVQQLKVVLLGDSHLQTGHYPEQLSRHLQKKHNSGGFGLFFPNTAVQTYAPIGYTVAHTGKWQAQRSIGLKRDLPLGLRGMSCKTTESGVGFEFLFKDTTIQNCTVLKIYCKHSEQSYDLLVKANGLVIKTIVGGSKPEKGYLEIELPNLYDNKLAIYTTKSSAAQNNFELYGLSLETDRETGAILHNAGVGAAQYNSILYQSLFVEQLATVQPNLVIIDFGTNDYLYDDKIKPELAAEIQKVIDRVRQASPQTFIILTSVQDLYWKNKNCISATEFSQLIFEIAQKNNCGFYDWFYIAGGLGSLKSWNTDKLAQKDMVHLTAAGYRLKADLLYQAILNSIQYHSDYPSAENLIFERKLKTTYQPIEKEVVVTNQIDQINKKLRELPAENSINYSYHIVQKGQSLSAIATKYKTTVSKLLALNQLSDPNRIQIGQKLKIGEK